MKWLLAFLLLVNTAPGVHAKPLAERHVLAISPLSADLRYTELNRPCAQEIYRHILKSQNYQVLPDWYVAQNLQGVSWQENWAGAFAALPQADELLLLRLNQGQLMGVWLKRDTQSLASDGIEILKTEVLTVHQRDPLNSCILLSQQLLGDYQPPRFNNPALSASLSFIVPGAGHFYQGSPESVALGSVFLLTYLLVGGLGFSNATEPQVTRAQWGGLLFLLTLTDIVTAYFMASQEP